MNPIMAEYDANYIKITAKWDMTFKITYTGIVWDIVKVLGIIIWVYDAM